MTTTTTATTDLTCTIDATQLREAMSRLARIVPGNSPKPALQCVRIEARDGAARLTTTDQELAATATIRACEIHEPGTVLVNARRFADIAAKVFAPTIDLRGDGDGLKVTAGTSEFKLHGMPASDYPSTPEVDTDPLMSLDADLLVRAFAQTLPSVSREASRYAIAGVAMFKNGNGCDVVTTDGRRLSLVGLNETLDRNSLLIPTKAAQFVAHVAEGVTVIRADDGRVRFTCDDWTVTTAQIEGNFPPYKDVMPKDATTTVEVEVDQLRAALDQAALMTSEESRGVRFDFPGNCAGGTITLTSRAPELGDATARCECGRVTGDGLAIGLNPAFVASVLKVCTCETVRIEMTAPNKPALFIDGDFRCVVMPVNLQ